MMKEADVIIAGGGLAGLSAACFITNSSDLKVIIIDPDRSTINNPTRLTFKDTLIKNGLKSAILQEYHIFKLITANNSISSHDFAENVLVALDYEKARQIMKEEVKNLKNISFVKEKATDFSNDKGAIRIVLKGGAVLQSKLLIDSTGKAHFTTSRLSQNLPTLYSHSYGLLFGGSQHEFTNECYFIGASKTYGSGGGWFYPIGTDEASLGVAVVTDSAKFPGRELKKNFDKVLKQFQPFADYLRYATPVRYEVGTIPIDHIDRLYYDRILIIGDAAGHATPWMCMGVESALLDGELAAKVALESVKYKNYSEDFLLKYQLEWNKKNYSSYEYMRKMQPKLWFMDDEIWDFIVQYDLSKLTSEQLYERIRYNAHLMSRFTSLQRWVRFRISKKYLRFKSIFEKLKL